MPVIVLVLALVLDIGGCWLMLLSVNAYCGCWLLSFAVEVGCYCCFGVVAFCCYCRLLLLLVVV